MPKYLRGISFLLHDHILASFLRYREFSVPFPPAFKKKKRLSSQPEDNHLAKAETNAGGFARNGSALKGQERRTFGWKTNSDLAFQCLQLSGPTQRLLPSHHCQSQGISSLFNNNKRMEPLQWTCATATDHHAMGFFNGLRNTILTSAMDREFPMDWALRSFRRTISLSSQRIL